MNTRRTHRKRYPSIQNDQCNLPSLQSNTLDEWYIYNRLIMAPAYSCVFAFPPKSPVSAFPSASVSKIAFSILDAWSFNSICLNIMIELRRSAVGLARAFPAISGAELFVSGELATTSSGRGLELLLPRQVLERAAVSRELVSKRIMSQEELLL
jgi:hypothetical protein